VKLKKDCLEVEIDLILIFEMLFV